VRALHYTILALTAAWAVRWFVLVDRNIGFPKMGEEQFGFWVYVTLGFLPLLLYATVVRVLRLTESRHTILLLTSVWAVGWVVFAEYLGFPRGGEAEIGFWLYVWIGVLPLLLYATVALVIWLGRRLGMRRP